MTMCDRFRVVVFGYAGVVSRQTMTNKLSALEDQIDSRQQVAGGIRLDEVTPGTRTQCRFRYVPRAVSAHEENFGRRRNLSDSAGGLDSIEGGETEIEQNQARLQLLRF